MLRRLRNIALAFSLLLAPLSGLITTGTAHAAGSTDYCNASNEGANTWVWVGTGADNTWTDTANWTQNSVAPTSGAYPGDSSDTAANVCIDNSHLQSSDVITMPASITINSLTFENQASGVTTIAVNTGLTVTTDILQDSSDALAVSLNDNASPATVTLGDGAIVTTSSGGFIFGSNSIVDSLALNGTATFNDDGSNSGETVAIYSDIINGSGTPALIFDGPNTNFQLYANSTYSGTTDIEATDDLGLSAINSTGGSSIYTDFGISSITVNPAAFLTFSYSDATDSTAQTWSITNPITITGAPSANNVSIGFYSSYAPGLTYNVSGLVLEANAYLSNSNSSGFPDLVNLQGTTANNFCIDYGNSAGTTSNAGGTEATYNFENGPTACAENPNLSTSTSSTTAKTTPKTPDTGLAAAKMSQPIVVLAVMSAIAASLVVLGRKVHPASKK